MSAFSLSQIALQGCFGLLQACSQTPTCSFTALVVCLFKLAGFEVLDNTDWEFFSPLNYSKWTAVAAGIAVGEPSNLEQCSSSELCTGLSREWYSPEHGEMEKGEVFT